MSHKNAALIVEGGGIADSIPVLEAYRRGARAITVMLSRPLGYRKSASKTPWAIKRLFKLQPQLARAVLNRWKSYNAALEFMQNPPAGCQLNVVAPGMDFPVGRFTRNPIKLERGYALGRQAGLDFLQVDASTDRSAARTRPM